MAIYDLDKPCFCNRNLPYKDCHFQKTYDHPLQITKDNQEIYHSKGTCLHFENGAFCGEPTIASHSLQKEAVLRSIASDGHVATFSHGPHRLLGEKDPRVFSEIGIAKASTFPAFCERHDNENFIQLESSRLGDDSKTIPILAAYRACCHAAVSLVKNALFSRYLCFDAKFKVDIPITEEMRKSVAILTNNAADAWKRKGQYEVLIKDDRFRECFFYIDMEFNMVLPFASTGSFFIENGVQGQKLQSLSRSSSLASCEMWILPNTNGETYAGIAGIADNNPRVLKNMIDSVGLVSDNLIATKLFQIAACNIENTYIDPKLVNNLAIGTSHFIQAFHYRNCADKNNGKISRPTTNLSQMFPLTITGYNVKRKSHYAFKYNR